jgi:ribosomal subunit interface protein
MATPKQGEQVTDEFDIEITARGDIGSGDRRYAEDKLARVGKFAPRPILHARATLTGETNPAIERRAVAEASLDVSGRIVRAQVAATQMREAVDLLEQRLRRRLEELGDHYESRRQETGLAEPGEWRHGALPSSRPDFFDRPVEERELVRHKTFADGPETPEEAALDMGLLDHDFFLFTNAASGEENVVYRLENGAIGWLQPTPTSDRADAYAIDLKPDPAPASTMRVDEAIDRLDVSGERFVFFIDETSGRGNIVYRRYDGHYGLITPADGS